MLWVTVLNRALAWVGEGAALPAELGAGGPLVLAPPGAAQLATDVALLRATHASLALPRGRTPDEEEALRQWLAAVTLHLAPAATHSKSGLPPLRARRATTLLPPALDELLCTALVELLGAGAQAAAVGRCHGALRAAPARATASDDELRFARVAGLATLVAAGWRQCPRLVLAPRGARYCSKACSNAAFALRKGSAEPRYFASKQARYRARQALPARPQPSAFVAFID
jgi:hypothetical protein